MVLFLWGCAIPEKMRIGIKPQAEAQQHFLRAKELLGQKDY